ncbi:Diguanylate cyclase [Lysobacter dokdonensis DS-58]|uniref:diguanylate cyclase n=1 Tax=Lysobacter dokdonensis DS-58 TaxID=1300345 RepID=A0A0A2WIE9_9GAMM|nr:Diguanylate cyclase [Lysobacter dokdonensis DS-58]
MLAWCCVTFANDAGAVAHRPSAPRVAEGNLVHVPPSATPVRIPLHLARDNAEIDRLWVQRVMVDEVWLEHGTWRSPKQSFFRPEEDIPSFPTGFAFELPRGVEDVDLMISTQAPVNVRPTSQTASGVAELQQRGGALAGANYASLAVLAFMALSLFAAVRDRIYLALLALSASAFAWFVASNGHLYGWTGVRWFALWGAQGVWALQLLHCAAATWLAQRYAELELASPRLDRVGNVLRYVALGLAAIALLRLDALAWPMAWGAALVGGATLVFTIATAIVAVRNRVWNSLSVLTVVLLVAGAFALRAFAPFGIHGFWVRYGPQLALTICVLLVAVGMIGRIAHVRDERDRERLARGDSERRLEREAARVELVQQLQRRLRELPAGDLEWAAFRSVFERLLPLLRLESAALVAYGFHGFDLLLAEPISSKPHYTDLLAARMGMMKGLARTQAPVQLQLGNGESVHLLHGVVPLPIRAPAWGVLLLQRSDGSSFTDEELALASDFGRLAVQHADEAAAALSLRRSAELDALTGTFNRRTIDLWLSRCFSDAHREEQLLSVLFVDIDHFKSINDTHGHAAGDAVLRQVSEVLRKELQPTDLLGRYGGEEFVIVLPGRNGDDARQLGERIRSAIELVRLDYEGKPIRITVSVGVATRLPRESEPAAAVARADQALYAAKRGGRNRVNVAPAVFS